MAIRRKSPLSFAFAIAIANNLLAPNTKAIDLRICPQIITTIVWNNFENLEDGSFGRNNLKNVHISSEKAHLKTNGEKWLRLKQTKSYP